MGATVKTSSNPSSAKTGIGTATPSKSPTSATPITDHEKKSAIQTKSINPIRSNRLEAANTRAHSSSATDGERIHKPRRYPQTDAQVSSSRTQKP
jgi:hypothetical protein